MAVLLPDESEIQIMYEDLMLDATPYPGVQLTSLRRGTIGQGSIILAYLDVDPVVLSNHYSTRSCIL